VKIGPADAEILRLRATKSGTTQNWLPWQRPLRNLKKGIRKSRPDQENSRKYLPFGEKVVKIGPVDTEIALLRVKKEEITEGKYIAISDYSSFGKFAERTKR